MLLFNLSAFLHNATLYKKNGKSYCELCVHWMLIQYLFDSMATEYLSSKHLIKQHLIIYFPMGQ